MTDTEARYAAVVLDVASTAAGIDALIDGQRAAIEAVAAVSGELARAVDAAAVRLHARSGRLALVGAGASGRLCVQDGAELWPTFGWPHERLLLSIAGGDTALLRSVEGAEDDEAAAQGDVRRHRIDRDDVVIGVAASGRSPWTVSWLRAARERGALTVALANNAGTPLLEAGEHAVLLNSGAERLAGSTRLAAGTAQKAALNTFSTALMVRLNRTHDNLMVDMAASNAKLDQRRVTMLRTIVPTLDAAAAQEALSAADGWVKLAVLLALGEPRRLAEERLERHGGDLRAAMVSLEGGA